MLEVLTISFQKRFLSSVPLGGADASLDPSIPQPLKRHGKYVDHTAQPQWYSRHPASPMINKQVMQSSNYVSATAPASRGHNECCRIAQISSRDILLIYPSLKLYYFSCILQRSSRHLNVFPFVRKTTGLLNDLSSAHPSCWRETRRNMNPHYGSNRFTSWLEDGSIGQCLITRR